MLKILRFCITYLIFSWNESIWSDFVVWKFQKLAKVYLEHPLQIILVCNRWPGNLIIDGVQLTLTSIQKVSHCNKRENLVSEFALASDVFERKTLKKVWKNLPKGNRALWDPSTASNCYQFLGTTKCCGIYSMEPTEICHSVWLCRLWTISLLRIPAHQLTQAQTSIP